MKPIFKRDARSLLFTRTGIGVTWYAGLGTPFRYSSDVRDAVSFSAGSIGQRDLDRTLNAVEQDTGRQWFTTTTTEAYHKPNYRCAVCSVGWTHTELAMVKNEDNTSMDVEHAITGGDLDLGSPMLGPERDDWSAKVRLSETCRGCGATLCGAHATKKRGRNAHRCDLCRDGGRR